ncbi:proteasome activator pa28 beta subunit [Rhizoctonia solani 123E]|uniref:Proteasome activator pa28 beta subunit n=1 Tax=Rhizoctonia solani 123E TaxID=1423351 RepID=A0A074RS43_9AGAM|nr:proteasome activator pa28 beta subunit [Rhizoctonia solani 123E]
MPRHSSTATVDPAVADQLKLFHETVSKRAEDIVFKKFPQKILSINQKIEECSSDDSALHSSSNESTTDATVHPPPAESEPPVKKRRHENGDSVAVGVADVAEGGPRFTGRMVANHKLRSLHEDLKKEYMELVDLCDKVKLWVNLTMPKIEDGDNFGVQIQEGKSSTNFIAPKTLVITCVMLSPSRIILTEQRYVPRS